MDVHGVSNKNGAVACSRKHKTAQNTSAFWQRRMVYVESLQSGSVEVLLRRLRKTPTVCNPKQAEETAVFFSATLRRRNSGQKQKQGNFAMQNH